MPKVEGYTDEEIFAIAKRYAKETNPVYIAEWLEQTLFNAQNEVLKIIANVPVSGSSFNWDDDKVIDFVNWYIELHKLGVRYTIENRTIIDSFKNGDKATDWHCR